MSFQFAAKVSDVEPEAGVTVELNGKKIAVVQSATGEYYAMDDACPHAGYTMSEALIEDGCAECLAHGACYDLITGEAAAPIHGIINLYPVQLKGDEILVDVG